LRKMTILVVMAAMLCACGAALAATEWDLTPLGSEYWIGGALFSNSISRSTGTGIFDPFLSIQADPAEQGYNSDYRPVQFDESSNTMKTHALWLNTVPTLDIDGVLYREFRLDANQSANAPISLDILRIYQSSVPTLTGFDAGWEKIYDMDTGADNWVRVASGTGSGSGDMRLYVNSSLFTKDYITLYSYMGTNVPSNDGFEEWGVLAQSEAPPIPEASSIILALSGLPSVGVLGLLRRKRQSS